MKKSSAELTYMKERVEQLLVPLYRPPVTIGIRGPAGKGKTSLINALLSVDELAHTVRNMSDDFCRL
jgi:predicted GTPase